MYLTTGRSRRFLLGVVVALPLAYLLTMYMYPLLRLLYMSMADINPIFGRDEFVGLRNYTNILTEGRYVAALARTVEYTGIVVIANLLLGMLFALLTVEISNTLGEAISRVFRLIVMAPMLLLPAAGAVMWMFALTEHYGWVNHLMKLLGFSPYPWLASDSAFYWVMLTDIWGWTPFVYLILLAGIENLPREPLEAAKVDGATWLQTLVRVKLPMLKPVIVVALVIKGIDTYRAFDYLWIMTEGGPGEISTTLNIIVFKTAFRHADFGMASALGVVTLLLPLALVLTVLVPRWGLARHEV